MNSRDHASQVFELMQRLIETRYDKPLHHQLMKAADYSMLSEDVLVLIYHMAKICEGGILEIGSFLGASTVAAAMGARASGREKKFVSIEPGGALKDHKLATKNIFKDLTKHVARAGVENAVTLLNGSSFDDQHDFLEYVIMPLFLIVWLVAAIREVVFHLLRSNRFSTACFWPGARL